MIKVRNFDINSVSTENIALIQQIIESYTFEEIRYTSKGAAILYRWCEKKLSLLKEMGNEVVEFPTDTNKDNQEKKTLQSENEKKPADAVVSEKQLKLISAMNS